MASTPITDELVARIAADLQERYGFDSEAVRLVGERLAAHDRAARAAENAAFADRFVADHPDTFDRLGR